MSRWGGFCLSALVLGMFIPGAAWGIPKGNIGTWVESRHFQYGAFARDIDYSTNVVHVDGLWFPDNAGIWSTLLEYTSFDAEFLVDGRDIPTDIGRFGVTLGDFGWNAGQNDLRREYRQNVLVRGASISLDHGLEWQATAGALAERGLYMGSGRRPTGIGVVRLGVGQTWEKKGRWNLDWEHQTGSQDLEGRQVGAGFINRQFGEFWNLQTEGRLSRTATGMSGSSVAAGVSRKASRSGFGLSVRRISPGFRGVGLYRDPHVNEVGGRIHSAVRFGNNGLAGFFFDYGRDLAIKENGRDPEERLHGRLNFSAGLGGPLYMQSRLTYRDRSTVDPDSLFVDQNTVSGRLEAGVRTRKVHGYASYGRNLFRSRLEGEPDWHETRVESQANIVLGPWIRTQLSGFLAERTLPDGTWTSSEKRVEARFMAEPSERRRAWLLMGRERQDASLEAFERDNMIWGLGWYQTLPQDFGFEIEGQIALDSHTHDLDYFRWTGRITHRFNFGKDQITVDEAGDEYGTVSGFVFEDRNGNGRRDPLEPGIPGQFLKLGSGPSMTTREDGSFFFEKAAITLDFLYFKATHLASRYLPPQEDDFELHLLPGDNERINIPVRLAASVQGRVMGFDENGNTYGVSGALIRVQGSHRDAFTNERGEYVIGGLAPGKQVLEIVGWSIPKLHENMGSAYKTVKLEAGERTMVTDFELKATKPVLLQIYKP